MAFIVKHARIRPCVYSKISVRGVAVGFPERDGSLKISGPCGVLELAVSVPKVSESSQQQKVTVVICHPHPLFEGTLHNKVVHTLARTFKQQGLYAVRFNFRGVGHSTGEYSHGIGETADLAAVIDWVKAQQPDHEIWLAGFSFGGYVAYRGASRFNVNQLLLVAPAVVNFDFGSEVEPNCPTFLIQGMADEVVAAEAVLAWAEKLAQPPQIKRFEEAGHFFHGRLVDLRKVIEQHYFSSF
ncbi:alpha/beta hydrolase [Piscirickettsia salmonis]|uniref:alpha/beta hydrolase n=1 Tax=Piscirickettsia salmonis TaxID=1238 RepID=UPI001E291FDD|nr:alpha/beta fold hydrolase [Piscirickettsia salmonis]